MHNAMIRIDTRRTTHVEHFSFTHASDDRWRAIMADAAIISAAYWLLERGQWTCIARKGL